MSLGTNDRVQKILEVLNEDDATTIILDGMHGVGKTWTAREISNSLNKDSNHSIQWLYLNNKYVSSSLDEDIARQLSLFNTYEEWEDDDVEEEEEKSLGNLRERICLKFEELRSAAFKERKIFLLILDGAHHDQHIEEMMSEYKLFLADQNKHHSFKLLITRGGSDGRETEKEIETGCIRVLEIDSLSIEESFVLVEAKLKKEFLDSPSFGILSNVIVQISKGMPNVIRTIVKALNFMGYDEFGVLLQEADDYGEAAISRIVHSLYSRLSRGVQMDCFWHSMHFFCRHAGVHYNELIAHWILEGYVKYVDHIEKAYEQGHHILMQLINRGMLRKDEDNMVTLGGILSSVADHRRCGFNGTASLGLANAFEDDENWKGLGSLTHSDGMIKSLCRPNTWDRFLTLIMDGRCFDREVTEKNFQQMKRLYVFALLNPRIRSLPRAIISMKDLSVLVLRCCDLLDKIDHIRELANLSVLELSGATRLEVIPYDLFDSMLNLRSLNISGAKFKSLPSSLFEKSELRWLILRECSQLTELPSLKVFRNLQVLDLSGAISFKKFQDKTFAPLKKLQTIDLSYTQINRLPFLHNLGELTRVLLTGCARLTRLPSLNTLSQLQILDLSGATAVRDLQEEPLDALKVLNLSGTQIDGLPSSISDLTELYLRDCSELLELPLIEAAKGLEILDLSGSKNLIQIKDISLQHMSFLRILNFSNVKVIELPSLSGLVNLCKLLLVDCSLLQKLPEMEDLKRLQVLNISGCEELVFLPHLNAFEKLEILDASGCRALKEIPDNSFDNMSHIQTLNLSDTKIDFVPSLSKASNLCHLILRNCDSLRRLPFLGHLLKLQQLNLKGCSCLETVQHLEALTLLEILDLSGTAIESLPPLNTFSHLCQLLLRDCSRIEELQLLGSLRHLEVLDLSGTRLKFFPYEISELPHLKRLDLPDLRGLHDLDSGRIKCIPQEVNWDQCGFFEHADINIFDKDKPSILVSDSEIFQILDKNPKLWETKLKSFHLCIIRRKGGDGELNWIDELLCRDVYLHTRRFDFPQEHDRRLEIYGSNSHPKGFESVLKHAECISLVDNHLIKFLCDFGAQNLKAMKGCWIQRCNQIEGIHFAEMVGVSLEASLEILWISNLPSLRNLYCWNENPQGFKNLKYLYIDSCPMIETLFPLSQLPEIIESLQVQFCDRLKTLFECDTPSPCTFAKLRTLYLLELPELTTIGIDLTARLIPQVINCPKLRLDHATDEIEQVPILVAETPPMAQEIELYLMEKFRNGLDGKDRNIYKIPRYNQFQEMKALLEEIFSSSFRVHSSIRGKLYDLNNVLTECQMISRKNSCFNSEILTINRIQRELNKMKKELKLIIDSNKKRAQSYNNGQSSSQLDRNLSRWPTRSVDASKVYGFDDDVVTMTKLLVQHGSNDGEFRALGIVGKEGIGKTTLCQVIFNTQEVKDKFLPRIWVCMAKHPDDDGDDQKVVIVRRMLVYLGVEKEMVKFFYEKHGLAGLLYALHLQLAGKRYLIVLDDARDMDSWYGQLDSCLTRDKKWGDVDRLAFGLPKGHGGKVIVTSRNEGLLRLMVGEENMHRLLPLSDPDSCWKIFKDADKTERISSIQKLELKQKCGGIPLEAKMMGEAMEENFQRMNS